MDGLDQYEAIADLFGSGRVGYETDAHFAEFYQDQQIEWTGTVDVVRPFENHPDFGESGIEVTVYIGTRGDSDLATDRVHAVIGLLTHTVIAAGDEVEFAGILRRVDRYTKKLYLADATLLPARRRPRWD